MNHFLHKHRYWFAALVIISAVAIFYFQMKDDGGTVPGPVGKPADMAQPSQRLPSG